MAAFLKGGVSRNGYARSLFPGLRSRTISSNPLFSLEVCHCNPYRVVLDKCALPSPYINPYHKNEQVRIMTQGYIDGRGAPSSSGNTFPVYDPATSMEIAQVADMDAKDARRAIQAAKDAWGPWRRKAPKVCIARALLGYYAAALRLGPA